MAKLQKPPDLSNLHGEEFDRYASIAISAIIDVVNGSIDFVGNVNCQILDVDFPIAGSTTPFQHKLGRVPTGFMTIKTSTPTVFNDGSGIANTTEIIYLQSTSIATGKVLVF